MSKHVVSSCYFKTQEWAGDGNIGNGLLMHYYESCWQMNFLKIFSFNNNPITFFFIMQSTNELWPIDGETEHSDPPGFSIFIPNIMP
jgi:hypothetical protein